ncbi:hypothetical protein NM688_g2243 [Phlebia brevispora]|uniref:Uncharacterized protein n=1 Tax=Phlebia brevispora TaxID=194682 RepID=A0ACC1T9D1_9APHY|nr:hypothetical protein NM688_g2243 [Phlebia brevispora]
MSTRQNKKRKGRGNALNRERTVTTLTEGPEAPFLSASPSDDTHINLMPAPFSSPTGAPTLSPAFSMSGNFNAFSYGYIPPMSGPFPSQQSMYGAQQLPPGQSDLEILERLKETIKSNQHEFFQPIPRPAALLNLYMGPRHAPLHPEQIPQSGEDRRMGPSDSSAADANASAPSLSAKATAGDSANEADASQKFATSLSTGLKSVADSPGKSIDIDPPGLNTPLSATDPSAKFDSDITGTGASRLGASNYQKYDSQALGRSATEKSASGESPYAQRAPGDSSTGKIPARDSSWTARDPGASQDDAKARPDHDRIGTNGRSSGDQRSGAHESNRWQRPYRDYDQTAMTGGALTLAAGDAADIMTSRYYQRQRQKATW